MTITDLHNRPWPNIAGRMVLGMEAGWENASRGVGFETDANGKTVFQIPARLSQGMCKRPANFLSSLLALKETTDDLQIAVELTYANEPLLHVAKVHRFRGDGTALLGAVTIFSRDVRGDFTIQVPRSKDGSWLLPQFGGHGATVPRHEIADFFYQPDERDVSGRSWILRCQFKRSPPPVRR